MEEVMNEIYDLYDNGADVVEVFEWIEENTNLDPCKVITDLFFN